MLPAEADYWKTIFLRPEFSTFVSTFMPFMLQDQVVFNAQQEENYFVRNNNNQHQQVQRSSVSLSFPEARPLVFLTEYNTGLGGLQQEYIVSVTSPLPAPASPMSPMSANSVPSSPVKVSPSPTGGFVSAHAVVPGPRRGKTKLKVGLKRTAKNRLIWTKRLQQRFLDAIAHFGVETARPKDILKFMAVEGLTRENVASHFQKFKQKLRRNQNEDDEDEDDDSEEDYPSDEEHHLAAGTPPMPGYRLML